MKTTIKEIVNTYKVLGEAKVTKLEESEVTKILKIRKAMRKIAEDFEAFLKDCQEKFKPENWDEIQQKIQQWQQEGDKTTLTDEEKKEVNEVVIDYQRKIDATIKDEYAREVEIEIEVLNIESQTKLLQENNWQIKDLDIISIIF